MTISDDFTNDPGLVAEAINPLPSSGVDGPYAIALGPQCDTGLTRTTEHGHQVMTHVERIVGGAIVGSGGRCAVVVNQRGGDFVVAVGQDFSIGYASHTESSVNLYIEESFICLAYEPEAAVPLRYARK